MAVTMQTVYVRSAEDVPSLRKLFQAYYRDRMPPTSFIVQPPCEGQALAIEAWALGGDDVDIRFLSPEVATVSYDYLRWVYIAGVSSSQDATSAYAESEYALAQLSNRLESAGATFRDVPRLIPWQP